MTDRVNYLIVALKQDVRIDDAQPYIDAIKLFDIVLSVEANVVNSGDWIAEERARTALGKKLFEVIYPGYDAK